MFSYTLRERKRTPQGDAPEAEDAPEVADAPEKGDVPRTTETPETAENTTLETLLREIRQMREETARREDDIAAAFRLRDEELQRLTRQLSPLYFTNTADAHAARRDVPATGACAGVADADVRSSDAPVGGTSAPVGLGYKLKPDVFDGTIPLREFFSQFNWIARANGWKDAAKAVALASCLRGKARSILETVQDTNELEYSELKSKLELRFGEGHLAQNYYAQFTNRKQKSDEDLATLGSDLERLSRLAYPESPAEIRDKIACAQFIMAISDRFVRRTLQLEGVTSLNLAIERAKAVRVIQGNFDQEFNANFDRRKKFWQGKGSNGYDRDSKTKEEREKDEAGKVEKGKGGVKGDWRIRRPGANQRECWICGKAGHFRSECPAREKNEA